MNRKMPLGMPKNLFMKTFSLDIAESIDYDDYIDQIMPHVYRNNNNSLLKELRKYHNDKAHYNEVMDELKSKKNFGNVINELTCKNNFDSVIHELQDFNNNRNCFNTVMDELLSH